MKPGQVKTMFNGILVRYLVEESAMVLMLAGVVVMLGHMMPQPQQRQYASDMATNLRARPLCLPPRLPRAVHESVALDDGAE